MIDTPFNPAYGSGQSVTSGASASVTINSNDRQVCVTNTGNAIAYVRVDDAGTNATAADYPVMPGTQVLVSKGAQTKLQHFCATATTLHIMTGNGW